AALLLLGDRLGELLLAHAGAALDAVLLGTLVQLLLGVALDVDAAVGPGRPPARLRGALLRLGVGRALAVLRLPVVAAPLEGMLERGVGGAVRPLPLAVGLNGAVVGLGVGALRLGGRALHGAGQVLLLADRHGSPPWVV